MAKSVRRLYGAFQPDSYLLDLSVEVDKKAISGKVVIDGLKKGRPSNRITFHQKNLNIKNVLVTRIDSKGNVEHKTSRINYQRSYDEVRLHFKELLYPGRYRIEIEYTGKINTQLHGVYLSTFKEGKKEKNIICTQFESHHAREALPCIDEPEAKAKYTLTLTTPSDLKAVISNTDSIASSTEKGLTTTSFETTPKMSSYLLAFVVGDLKYTEAKTINNVRVRSYATPDKVESTKFSLDCAVKTLEFYEEYFAIKYPLSKCDLIALPDFASGAMENWGCITFREQALLVDSKHTSLELKQYVANVVAHELTHQWFGNLVTMKWWNDLWLNESFASWMSYLAVDHLFPEWKVWVQFIVDEQGIALKQDSLEFTHPIENKINNPDEIRTVFDVITYEKGASVITMLQDYVGEDNFRDGVRNYLAKHSYGNTGTKDLWEALEEVSNKPVATFMDRWTKTSGYPLVKVDYNEGNVHLQQHRFYLNPMAKKDSNIWPIPLFSELDLGKNDPFVHRSINVRLPNQPASMLINKGRTGFYRSIYDDQTVTNIVSDDFMNRVSDVDRLGLLADAFEAAKAGYLKTTSALELLKSYSKENSVVVWEVIAGALGSIRNAMDDEDLRDLLKPYIRELVKSELKRLGTKAKKTDSHFDRLLRPTIVGMASSADEPAVVKELKSLFKKSHPEQIDPDIRGVVYGTVAHHGNQADFDKLVKMHNESTNSEERLKLTAAISGFKQPKIIKQALALIDSDSVRSQDVGYWVAYSFSNHYARDESWKWLKAHWQWLSDNLGEDLSFYRIPFYVARCYSSLEFLKEFEEFFSSHTSSAFERPVKQSIETIQWQADWKRRDLASIKKYFK